jgi:poly-gamma-glutamate synthesis protein (capsule biosynthesis protein)
MALQSGGVLLAAIGWLAAMHASACGPNSDHAADESDVSVVSDIPLDPGPWTPDPASSDVDPWADAPDVDTGILDPHVPPVNAFPYVFVDDDPAPEYLRFQAEGLSFEESLVHALDYLKKAVEHKLTAPTAEVEYFERQAELFGALAAASAAAGARGDEEGAGNAGAGGDRGLGGDAGVEGEGGATAFTLGLVGDLMWIRDGWETFLDDRILQYMRGVDVWLGNLETPIAASFVVPSAFPDYKNFNSAPGLVESFAAADGTSLFAALSFANNHTLDMEDEGALETLGFLADEEILSGGAWKEKGDGAGDSVVLFERGGVKVGLYAATWGLNEPSLMKKTKVGIDWVPGLAPEGTALVDLSKVRAALDAMVASGAELRIVFLHWGHEYEVYPSPLQVRLARELVHAGADIVVGAHPHVQQPMELCFVNGAEQEFLDAGLDFAALHASDGCVISAKGRPRKALVVYSLGNFASAMSTLRCQLGMLVRLQVYRNGNGEVGFDLPAHAFVVNQVDFPPDDTHRLMPADAYFDAGCYDESGECPAEVGEQWASVRALVNGVEEEIP